MTGNRFNARSRGYVFDNAPVACCPRELIEAVPVSPSGFAGFASRFRQFRLPVSPCCVGSGRCLCRVVRAVPFG